MKSGRDLLKSCVSFVAGDYEPYRIYSRDLTRELNLSVPQGDLHFRVNTDDEDALIITASVDELSLCSCHFWFSERYRRERNFYPLENREAKLVHIETAPAARGRGIAGQVLAFASAAMKSRGFERLYARIWHNNQPSINAFMKAGWMYEGFVLQVAPPPLRRPVRFSTAAR